MKALVTGAGGLVGSAAIRRLVAEGYDIIGLENDMRSYFFGPGASTMKTAWRLGDLDEVEILPMDIRARDAVERMFAAEDFDLIIHTAAQPSHDWAAREPHTDFDVNAVGTLTLLQAAREHAPGATFAHISTSKVYGDRPNLLPLIEYPERFDLPMAHQFYNGITPEMSVDTCTHSLFGVSKLAGDLLVQEYGRYFDMPTVCFRPGCVTGADHQGVELHGFLNYLMKCCVEGRPYRVYGYGGRQVRCNIEARDLVAACLAFHGRRVPGAVYNIGGGRDSNCSMLEAICACERIAQRELEYEIVPENRIGDHMWWISDNGPFIKDYPEWGLTMDTEDILRDIHDHLTRA